MKGGDTTKPAYSYYTDKMWRYFIPRQKWHQDNGTQQTLFQNDVERENYGLCQQVWDGLTDQEREILALVHCTGYEETSYEVQRYDAAHGMRDQSVWSIAHQIGKELAIKKHLVPERKGGAF